MTADELSLIIGEEAFLTLSETERNAIAAKFTVAQTQLAAMASFDLLRKKFQPSYKMGRLHEASSEKFLFYDKLYKEYASTLNAGRRKPPVIVRKNPFVS